MMNLKKNVQVVKISVFITSIFVILLSVTYAFINQTLVGTKRQVITAGNLELELLEDENNLTIEDALPMYDEVGMLQEAFTFRIINKTTMNTNYVLKLVDITASTDKLDTSIVKYGLVRDGVSSIKLLSTLNDGVIDKGVITGEQTIEYSLRLWIDSKVEDEDLIRGKTLSYRIEIEAGQDTNKPVYAMIRKTDFEAFFWQYADNITSIVFENSIDIPAEIEEDKKWDVSVDGNGSVMAYIEPNNEKLTTYQLHIQGKDGVSANTDSSHLFGGFYQVTTIEGLEYFDTTNVTNMFGMFNECSSLTSLDVSHFNTSNVTDMTEMFSGCSSLTSLDVSSFNTANVTSMNSMFYFCSSLMNLDVTNFVTTKVTNMRSMFSGCEGLTSLDVSNFDTTNVTDMGSMFNVCSNLMSLDLSHFDTTNVTDMSNMFQECSSLISLDVSHFNTTNVTDMHCMFYRCYDLVDLDLSSFNTLKVTNMKSMFNECRSLVNLDVSHFDTSKVTNMFSMFYECRSLTSLDLSSFNTTNVTSMSSMFDECRRLTSLDLSSFNTTNVTSMSSMFYECRSLTSLDLSSFDTTNVKDMTFMFYLVKTDCLITVKDEAMKALVLDANDSLTNIVVKSV